MLPVLEWLKLPEFAETWTRFGLLVDITSPGPVHVNIIEIMKPGEDAISDIINEATMSLAMVVCSMP